MRRFGFVFAILILGVCASSALAFENDWYNPTDPLAQRDQWGLRGQEPLDHTDFFPRWGSRWNYYFQSGETLITDPAYVAALQVSLRRAGYYHGPTNGNFSSEVSHAIAQLQKRHALHVTGTLTLPVRRVLFLP